MNKMQKYVLVFIKNVCGEFLGLVKSKPEWQRGKYNLPGGKVEPGETYEDAAIRELKEETGINCSDLNIYFCGFISGKGYKIAIYQNHYYYDGDTYIFPKMEEQPEWLTNADLQLAGDFIINNLKLIVPLLELYSGKFVVNGDSGLCQEVRFYD